METLIKLFSNIVFTSALLLVLGGLLLFAPNETLQTYVRVIGIVLLAGAALGLLLEFVIKSGPRSAWVIAGACAWPRCADWCFCWRRHSSRAFCRFCSAWC